MQCMPPITAPQVLNILKQNMLLTVLLLENRNVCRAAGAKILKNRDLVVVIFNGKSSNHGSNFPSLPDSAAPLAPCSTK